MPEDMYPVTFIIDGLDLEPIMEVDDNITLAYNATVSNMTFLTPYYVAVKAVTGKQLEKFRITNRIISVFLMIYKFEEIQFHKAQYPYLLLLDEDSKVVIG